MYRSLYQESSEQQTKSTTVAETKEVDDSRGLEANERRDEE